MEELNYNKNYFAGAQHILLTEDTKFPEEGYYVGLSNHGYDCLHLFKASMRCGAPYYEWFGRYNPDNGLGWTMNYGGGHRENRRHVWLVPNLNVGWELAKLLNAITFNGTIPLSKETIIGKLDREIKQLEDMKSNIEAVFANNEISLA